MDVRRARRNRALWRSHLSPRSRAACSNRIHVPAGGFVPTGLRHVAVRFYSSNLVGHNAGSCFCDERNRTESRKKRRSSFLQNRPDGVERIDGDQRCLSTALPCERLTIDAVYAVSETRARQSHASGGFPGLLRLLGSSGAIADLNGGGSL